MSRARAASSGLVALVALVAAAAPCTAAAQDEAPVQSPVGVAVSVRPLELPAGVEPPGDPRYLYLLSVEMATLLGVDVVADRRLLWLDVQEPGARRPLRCADPSAPRFSRAGMRVRTLGPALGPAETRDAEHPTAYAEWVDLRAYCGGRALAALDRGARVTPHYGFARGPRDAWVARTSELTGLDARRTKDLVGEPFDVAPRPAPPAPTGDALVSLAPFDRSTQDGATFRASLRATSTRRVYVLPDQWRFRIRSALGTHECGLRRETVSPIADFFRTVDRRRAATLSLDAHALCPGAFELAGVYEVTPIVVLPYPAPAPHADQSLTGTFEGPAVVVRIRRGDRGYVEQLVEDLAPPVRRPS